MFLNYEYYTLTYNENTTCTSNYLHDTTDSYRTDYIHNLIQTVVVKKKNPEIKIFSKQKYFYFTSSSG
jgi:hypothetical protein